MENKENMNVIKHDPKEYVPVIINALGGFTYKDSEIPTIEEMTENGEYSILEIDLDGGQKFDLTTLTSVETMRDKDNPELQCVVAKSQEKMIIIDGEGNVTLAIKK